MMLQNLRRLLRGEIGLREAAKNIWLSARRRLGWREFGRRYFDEVYRIRDPWRYETSPYEKRKYRDTLAVLPRRRFDHILEIGCSIGVFTEMVADRADRLTAVEISSAAALEADRRCRRFGHVRVRCGDFLDLKEKAAYDLILATEVLYFLWQPIRLRRRVRKHLASLLAEGGTLVLVWGGFRLEQDWDAFLEEDGRLRLQMTRLFDDPKRPYRISLFEPAGRARSG